MFIKKVHLFLLTALLLVGNVSAWGEDVLAYTITFANGSSSSSSMSSSTKNSTVIADDGSRNYTTSTPFTINNGSCHYGGGNKDFIRIGSSGNAASLSIALSATGQVVTTKIVVNAKNYGGSGNANATLSVNSLTAQTTSDEDAADYTFSYAIPANITNITLNGSASIYIYSISVYTVSDDPIVYVSPSSLDFGNDIEQGASVDAQTFTLAGYGLTGAISIAAPISGFTVSPTSITPTDGIISATDITVTPITSDDGTFDGDITISDGGLESSSTIALTMTVIPVVAVTGVTLDESSLSLTAGESETLTATIAPEGATNKNVVWSTSNSNVAKVSGGVVTAVGVGSATITVTSVADESKSSSCSITVLEAIPYGKITSSRSDWTGEYLLVYEAVTHAVAWTGADSTNCGINVAISNNIISIVPNKAVSLFVGAITGGYSIEVSGGANTDKYIGMKNNENGLKIESLAIVNSVSYGTAMNIVSSSAVLRYNSASNQQRFRYYKTDSYISQKAIQLYRKNYFPLTISSVGWASLYLPYAATIPTGVQAYYASSTDGENITLTEITGTIPAYTGVVVRGTAGTYGFEKSDVSPAALSDNLLIGVTAPKDTTHSTAYVLAGVDPDDTNCILFKLYKNASDNNDVTLGAYKSYIPKSVLPGSPDRIRFIIADGNNTTSIEATKVNESAVKFVENGQLFIKRDDVVYDVMGRIVK